MQRSIEIIITSHLKDASELRRNETVEKLRKCLYSCGDVFKVTKWEPLEIGSTEISKFMYAENTRPYLKELLLEIDAKLESPNYYNDYNGFLKLWNQSCQNVFNENELPYIMFKSDYGFLNTRNNYDENLSLQNFGHGTMVSPSHFVQHQDETNCWSNFYHDDRTMEIILQQVNHLHPIRRFRFKYPVSLQLSYNNVNKILVSENSMVFQLVTPMLIYKGFKRILKWETTNDPLLGRSNSILLTFRDKERMLEVLGRFWSLRRNSGLEINHVLLNITRSPIPTTTIPVSLSFNFEYLIEAINQRTFALFLQCMDTFVLAVKRSILLNERATENALTDLVHLCDRGHHFHFLQSFNFLFDVHVKLESKNKDLNALVPSNTELIRRAVITPTRILLWPPEICVKNRIIRNFEKDFALRVSFRDEDYMKLNAHPSFDNEVVEATIKNRMTPGIQIAGRHYQFLAWSNSQIRDHGVWMYAQNSNGETASTIRQWMGDFSNIKCVPKYMSRMGQCFSQTEDGGQIPFNPMTTPIENDIERGLDPESNKPYCFSDGVGQISPKIVKMVCQKLKLKKTRSAFQIRYGGSKGMLLLNPNLKTDIVLRKSMVKFDCPQSSNLEVCKYSKAIPVALNRPLISILDYKGVKTHVFLRLQEDALENLTDMFFNQKKAAEYLSSHQNLPGVDFPNLVNCGINPTIEPFFRSMLMSGQRSDVDNILKKARLFVDPSEGRNMFGVIDETGTLEYGQVFVQYTKHLLGEETNLETVVLKGNVMLTKNPCYTAGDVRILEAIDVPALRHVVDCIVFPQKGPRPHPNEMSGSDLDGDEYTVIWNKELMFNSGNSPASHFPVPKNELLNRPIEVSDMLNFLCTFIGSDNIGVIASSHLALADSGGVNSRVCQLIARKCSIAVDFAKNGEKVVLNDYERPEEYPDFMEKRDKSYVYESKKALGKLYRVCKDFCKINISSSESYKNVQFDPLLEYPGWKRFKDSAKESLEKYNNQLDRILQTYGVRHENEAMSGCYDRLHSRYSQYKDRAEIIELVALNIKELWRLTKTIFIEEFSGKETLDYQGIFQKASAWYMVTYEKKNPQFLSFPWIISNHLSQIKAINLSRNKNTTLKNPVLVQLEENLNRFEYSVQLKKSNYAMNDPLTTDIERYLIAFAPRHIERKHLFLAVKLLIKWASYHNLLQANNLKTRKSRLTPLVLAQILVHVIKRRNDLPYEKCETISLVIAFLKFCMSLRFLAKSEQNGSLAFEVPRLNVLSKMAMSSYRYVALSRSLIEFGIKESTIEEHTHTEMETFRLPGHVLKSVTKEALQKCLREWSGVSGIKLRLKHNSVLISADGLTNSIHILQSILEKDMENIIAGVQSEQCPL